MIAHPLFVLRFYGLIVGAVALVFLGFFVEYERADVHSHDSPKIRFSLWGLSLELPVAQRLQRKWIGKTAFFAGACAALAVALTTDFSGYFPGRLRMDVFFDIDGIAASLDAFAPTERDSMRLAADWQARIADYDQIVKASLAELWPAAGITLDTAQVRREYLHATGETTIVVSRVGLTTYRIADSEGYLEHTIEAPRSPIKVFRTEFELRHSASDFVQLGLGDIIGGARVIQPRFNQVLRVTGVETGVREFDHTVVGLTKVRALPIPGIGRTVYLWIAPDGGRVPIAYAVYY